MAILKTLSKSNVKYFDQMLSLEYFTDQICFFDGSRGALFVYIHLSRKDLS